MKQRSLAYNSAYFRPADVTIFVSENWRKENQIRRPLESEPSVKANPQYPAYEAISECAAFVHEFMKPRQFPTYLKHKLNMGDVEDSSEGSTSAARTPSVPQ